ncbi:UNVERIFIED_CONTAM: hypothetical protein K2H54_049925 [Gekko kuhli]
MADWTVVALAVLLAVRHQARGGILLPPPRNVILVSKDFNLFLTWLPGADYPPGVFYTIQWMWFRCSPRHSSLGSSMYY